MWSDDVSFERDSLNSIYIIHQINPDRLEQIKREVDFGDMVFDLTGRSGSEISCPFHGTDRTPSFYIYPPARGNNGWCFGCPPGKQYWDHVRFVRELLGFTYPKAVAYIEKTYNLPHIEDVPVEDIDEEAGEITVTLEFADLAEPYIITARREIQLNKDIEQTEEFLRIYFEAEKLATDAKALAESNEIEDDEERREEVSKMKTKAAMKLARVLGPDALDAVAGYE
jgi:CHC2-type zinc finger protein